MSVIIMFYGFILQVFKYAASKMNTLCVQVWVKTTVHGTDS